MEQLASKQTLLIDLSTYEPSSSYTINRGYSIQGVTDIIFSLSAISAGVLGWYKISGMVSGTNIFTISPIISGTDTLLPQQYVTYTTYPSTGTFDLKVYIYYRNGKDVTYNITCSGIASNMLDLDLTVLNTQMFYNTAGLIPIFNLESNSNSIYPVAYVELSATNDPTTKIYLKTDPEPNDDSLYINTETGERIRAI